MEETIVVDNEIILGSEICMSSNARLDASVAYFVVCKKGQHLIGGIDAYNQLIAGEKIISWVARACEKTKVLEINDYQSEIDAVIPCLGQSEYVVILKGNVPLVTKHSINSVLNFAMQRNMNACKLKCGYIFRTEYLKEVGRVMSADCYNLSSNDFLEVVDFESLSFARSEISKRIYAYHSKNGVDFSSFDIGAIDANVQIGYNTKLESDARVLESSKILNGCKIGQSSSIRGAFLKDNVFVGQNSVIINSVLGNGCKIGDGVIIKNSKIGDGVVVDDGTRLLSSEIFAGAKINALCDIKDTKINQGAEVGTMSKLYKTEIDEKFVVFNGKVLIKKSEDEK